MSTLKPLLDTIRAGAVEQVDRVIDDLGEIGKSVRVDVLNELNARTEPLTEADLREVLSLLNAFDGTSALQTRLFTRPLEDFATTLKATAP